MRAVRRAVLAAVLAFCALPAVASGGSIVAGSTVSGELEFRGTGCGNSTSQSVKLPASVTEIQVKRPKVLAGAGETHITTILPTTDSITFTATGDGPGLCDPASDPDIPLAERRWSGIYPYEIAYRSRVQVVHWVQDLHRLTLTAVRPAKIRIPLLHTLRRIHWSTFGGRTAKGSGIMDFDDPDRVKRCNPQRCPGHGSRFRVVLSQPSTCADLPGRVYYGRVTFSTTTHVGVIKPGRQFGSHPHDCGSGKPKRVR